jgi:RNA polymerase sigma factor (TIGR02999 family)
MANITQLLEAAHRGDRQAAAELLPLVYDELRKLAAAKMVHEKPGQTLDATALVHEAYLRMVGATPQAAFDGRGHFFAAAAEAMRRILVDAARRKARHRNGGDRARVPMPENVAGHSESPDDLLAVDEALDQLARADSQAAELVKLHYFAGLTIEQAAAVLGVSTRKAFMIWAFARAWLFRAMGGGTTSTD